MKYLFIYFSFFNCLFETAFAQNNVAKTFPFSDSTYVISKIFFVGNSTTKEDVIEREMSLKPGKLLTHEELQYNINRIYSLKLFTKVEANIAPQGDSIADVYIVVKERWYFFPYPIAGYKDHDWSKIYYGFGVAHTNVGGRNIRVYGEGALGYDPYFSLGYYNPLVNVEEQLFFSGSVFYSKVRNRSIEAQSNEQSNFDEQRIGGNLGLGKRFSRSSTLSTSLDFLHLSVNNTHVNKTLTPTGVDAFFSFSTSYVYDTRDLIEYPRLGTYFGVSVSKIGLFNQYVDYQRIAFDFRRYIPLYYDMVFAGRIFSNIAGGGRIPDYGHTYFGYGDRIRGHSKIIYEGEQIIGTTVELHIPIIAPDYIRLEHMPIEQFRDIRYAVNFALFADAGNTWFRSQPLTFNDFISGYGAGIHFLLAYSLVARMEYGIPYNSSVTKGKIVFDLGAAL